MPKDNGKPGVDWGALIAASVQFRPRAVTAETYLGKFENSASNPVKLRCADGRNYAVKGLQAGRMVFNDQVAARLGFMLGGPIPEVALIVVSPELIQLTPDMAHMRPGISHGSIVLEDHTAKAGFQHLDQSENRARFACLAVFFGWMGGSDQQFIYQKQAPCLVSSVDHGHFFHGGPDWTNDSLKQSGRAVPDTALVRGCCFSDDELRQACKPLANVTPEQIATAVAVPPDEWGVQANERIALAEYLHRRQLELLGAYS